MVFVNLFSNSVKYTQGEDVKIETGIEEAQALDEWMVTAGRARSFSSGFPRTEGTGPRLSP